MGAMAIGAVRATALGVDMVDALKERKTGGI